MPIAKKYHEGNLKRTLERELKERENACIESMCTVRGFRSKFSVPVVFYTSLLLQTLREVLVIYRPSKVPDVGLFKTTISEYVANEGEGS